MEPPSPFAQHSHPVQPIHRAAYLTEVARARAVAGAGLADAAATATAATMHGLGDGGAPRRPHVERLLEAGLHGLGARRVRVGEPPVERERGGRRAGGGLHLEGQLHALARADRDAQVPRQYPRRVVEGWGRGQLGRGGGGGQYADAHRHIHGEGGVDERGGEAVLGGRRRAHGLLDAGELGIVAVCVCVCARARTLGDVREEC